MKNWVAEGIASDVNDFTAQPVDIFDRKLGGGPKKQHFFSSVRGAISDVSIKS